MPDQLRTLAEPGETHVDDLGVTFHYLGDEEVAGVALVQEVAMPRSGPEMSRVAGREWTVRFERPPVDRFEYRFELRRPEGRTELILDPDNPLRAPGAFGERSVIEFPDYLPPAWLTAAPPPPGDTRTLAIPSGLLGTDQPALLWSSSGSSPDQRLPILVALDGLEFAHYSGLLRMLDAEVANGSLPPMRALLLQPTSRDDHYSANSLFAEALADELIPFVDRIAPIAEGRRYRAGLGASLGGLAMLHVHRSQPDCLGALFLQSSSFLHHGYMLGFAHFARVAKFMEDVLEGREADHPIPIEMTCGAVELNLPNNRAVNLALWSQGYRAQLRVNRDAHNWIAWRDAWAPHLPSLLREAWA